MHTKIQLNFSSKVAADNRVLERSTLVNVACNSVSEAAELYEELKAALGSEVVTSQHKELTQIAAPRPQPKVIIDYGRNDEQDQDGDFPPLCKSCHVPMRKMQSKFKPDAYWWGCPKWRLNGCLEKMPMSA